MSVGAATFVAKFVDHDAGSRFLIEYSPHQGAPRRGSILHVHAFAEEANKSRRTCALAARALAADGWHVAMIDLAGCGDSSGDFRDATWSLWQDDVASAWRRLGQETGTVPVLWGLRLGALLASSVVLRFEINPRLLLWQPVATGRLFLRQFLRLKVASEAIAKEAQGSDTRALLAILGRGEHVEVAGYDLNPDLALPLDQAELEIPASYKQPIDWIEVSPSLEAPQLSVAGRERASRWQADGREVRAVAVGGETFWQTQEIAECQSIVDATVAALRIQ